MEPVARSFFFSVDDREAKAEETLRHLLAVVIALVMLALPVGLAMATSGSAGNRSGHPSRAAYPWVQRAIGNLRNQQRKRDAFRASPKGRRLRAESRARWHAVGAVDARHAAQSSFPAVIDAKPMQGLDPPAGTAILHYSGVNAAVVKRDGTDQRAIVHSTVPLRARDGSGHLDPVDLRFKSRTGGFETANASVPVTVGARVGTGASLNGTAIGLRPIVAAPAARAELVAGKPFFANTAADTDLWFAAQPDGVEIFSQLRSPDAPETQVYAVDMPDRANLRLRDDKSGAAEIVLDGRAVATVTPPSARDADGMSVPVAYRVHGDRLLVRVSHRGGDFRYPILVDPYVAKSWDWTASNSVVGNWQWSSVPTSGWGGSLRDGVGLNKATWGRGLYIWDFAGQAYNAYDKGEWRYLWNQGSSFIAQIDATGLNFEPSLVGANQSSCQMIALVRPGGISVDNYVSLCSPHTNVGTTLCASGAAPPCDYTQGTAGNYATDVVFITFTAGAGGTQTVSKMGGAALYFSDNDNPSTPTLTHSVDPSKWGDTGNRSVTIASSDPGLGMGSVTTNVPGSTSASASCTGGPDSICNASFSGTSTYSLGSLAEGTFAASARAFDVLGHQSAPGSSANWNVKVDHTRPYGPTLSGSLWDHRNQAADHRAEGLYDPIYTLSTSAGDALSGLKSISVQVDNGTPYTYAATCSGTDGCSYSTPPWTFNSDAYADGDHTITVTAKDQLADQPGVDNTRHVSAQAFTVSVDRRGDIYHAVDWEGDPATSFTTGEEFAQIGTQNMRHLTENVLLTRNVTPCVSDVRGCAQERSQTRHANTSPGTPDDYTVTAGTSADDPRLRDDSELLAPANSSLGSPTTIGPINDALQLWQRPPPAHGTTYSLYVTTTQTVTDERAEDEVTKLWLDSGTKMPLRMQTMSGGTVESDLLFVYDVGRAATNEVASDFFAAGQPTNPGQTHMTTLPLTDLPDPPDAPPPTVEEEIADAQAFRGDLGLRNDYTYVQGLLNDVSLENGADAYGIPLTPAERADLDARVAAEQDLSVVDDYGATQAAGSFAGVYVDQQAGGAIYVGFTNNVAANMAAVQAIYPHPGLLHSFPITPTRTVQQLDALQAQVESDMDAGTLAALRINSIGQDAQANAVVLTSPQPTAADQAVLTARYGPGVTIEQSSLQDADSAATHHTPPNIGGLKITSDQGVYGSPACTSGFGAVKNYNTAGHRGREYFDISAGHCLASTGDVGNSDRGYGLQWNHRTNGSYKLFGKQINDTLVPAGRRVGSDAASIQVLPGTQSNRIYVRTGKDAKPHLLRITGSVARFHKGQIVCHSGHRTQRQFCGRVLRPDASGGPTEGNGTRVVHLVLVKMSTCGGDLGDSGGPVYHEHKAFGIFKAVGTTGRNCPGTSGNVFAFTRIGFAAADLDGLELLR